MSSRTVPDHVQADPAQEVVVGHRGGVLLVLGGPGTGKTGCVVRHVRQRVAEGLSPDACLVVGPTRAAAARLRSEVGRGLASTHAEPLARTASSLAFAILRLAATREGEPMPRLMSGAEQDVVLRELLAGHRERATGPVWPEHLTAALSTAGLRAQLRDLLMRAVEHGLEAGDLRRLATEHDRPEWACAAAILTEYDQVTALSDPGSYDPAWICTAAADVLEDDPALRAAVHDRVRLVVVDDAQELTASAARLLDVVRPPDADALLVGDPDSAVLGFRGAIPGAFVELAHRWAAEPRPGWSAERSPDRAAPAAAVLRHRHGAAPAVGAVGDRVAARIGVVGGGAHRGPVASAGARDHGQVRVRLTRSAAQEAALVGRWLRRSHLVEGVPWAELAVIARSGRQQDTIRRALAVGGVPVQVDTLGLPLGQDPAVAPLLLAFDVVTRGPLSTDTPGAGAGWSVTPGEAVALLSSPLGGLDPVGLRRLRRRLRAREIAGGGRRGADELLARRLTDPCLRRGSPAEVPTDLEPVVRVGRILDAGHAALGGPGPAGGSAEEVLWALWSASGLGPAWAEQALAGGALGARADRDLDALLVLFAAAEAHVERSPGSGPRRFLDQVRSAEVAADTLVVGARASGAVEVLTPQAAAGRRWRRVAVVGVQDGVWPDLRLRDTLLGAEALVAAVHGRPVGGPEAWRSAQEQVRTDELRQFHVAVSRAREELLVTARSSTDDQPSGLLDLVDPDFRDHPPEDVPTPLTLRGLAGQLRRTAVHAHRAGDRQAREQAVDVLLRLAEAGVPGADPSTWWHTREVTTDRPLRSDHPVRISPSRVQTFLDCPLQWFLTSRGADPGGGAGAAEIGTLVHDVIAAAPNAPVDTLREELALRWPDLGLPPGWIRDRDLTRATSMIERYGRYVADAPVEGSTLVATELGLSVTISPKPGEEGAPVRLVGAVDRLERDREGRLVVVDLKTGSAKPTAQEVQQHAQLAAYQVAVEAGAFDDQATDAAAGPEVLSGGARLVQLGCAGPVAQSQPALADAEDPDWARRMVLQAGEGMGVARFEARDLDRRCRRCPARFACPLQPEGQAR